LTITAQSSSKQSTKAKKSRAEKQESEAGAL